MSTDYLDDVVLPTTPCPPSSASIEEWEREHADNFDDSPWGDSVDYETARRLSELKHAVEGSTSIVGEARAGAHRFEGQTEASMLSHDGMSWAEMASRTGLQVEQIARLFIRSSDDWSTAVDLEAFIRSDEWDGTMAALTERSGWTRDRLNGSFLPLLGVTTKEAARVRAGGGHKYGPEIYSAIERMRTVEGRSYGKIGKELAMERTTVAAICRRRGWKVPS